MEQCERALAEARDAKAAADQDLVNAQVAVDEKVEDIPALVPSPLLSQFEKLTGILKEMCVADETAKPMLEAISKFQTEAQSIAQTLRAAAVAQAKNDANKAASDAAEAAG